MLSNREKRLSHAMPSTSHDMFPNLEPSTSINQAQPIPYGMAILNPNGIIGDRDGSNYLKPKPHAINTKNNIATDHRNSHSLSHEFSQLYVSNFKSQVNSFTERKKETSNNHPPHIAFEEMNAFKKQASEAKKQLFYMEKVRFDYWCCLIINPNSFILVNTLLE